MDNYYTAGSAAGGEIVALAEAKYQMWTFFHLTGTKDMTTEVFKNSSFFFFIPSPYLTQLYIMFIFLQTGKYLTQNKMSRVDEDKMN